MRPPFDAITIDGERLQGKAILRYARELHKHTGQVWAKGILDLLKELINTEEPLTARTSGTTGAPKTIAVPRADLVASAQLTGRTFGLQAGDRQFGGQLDEPVGQIAICSLERRDRDR